MTIPLIVDGPYASSGENYFKKRIIDDDGFAIVALLDDNVAGYLVGGLAREGDYRILPKFAELENMYVLDSARSKGIGTKLYKNFIEWCRKNDVKKIKVVASAMNFRAIDFYKKNGFSDYNLTLESDI